MGMFDYIKVECKMPEPAPPPNLRIFQTKHFEVPYMETYRIAEDGRLIYEDGEYYTVPEEQRPYYGTPEWEKGLGKMIGMLGRRPLGDKDLGFDGEIEFWSDGSHKEEWWHFCARFENGSLKAIELIEHNPPNPTTKEGQKG